MSSDGIWRFELEPPIPTHLPAIEQTRLALERAYLAECNDAMARIYGYESAEQLVGLRLAQFYPPEKPESVKFLLQFIENEYRLTDVETIELDREGHPRHFLNTFAGVINESAELTQAWGIQRDITRQRVTEKALRENESHLRAIVEHATAGIAQTDLHGRFLLVNSRYCQLVGYSAEELTAGMRMQDITHPDDLPGNLQLVRQSIENGSSFQIEKRYIRKDGSIIWVNNSVTVVRNDHGDTSGLLAVSIDITDRKLAETHAAEAQRRQKAVFDAVRDAIVIYDLDGRIVEANPAACRIYGYEYSQIIGANARQAIHPDALPLFEEFVRVTSAGGEFRCDTVDSRSDGTTFPIEVIGTSFMYRGRPHLMAIIRDITERKSAVDRLSRLYAVAEALSEAMSSADVSRIAVEKGIEALGASAGSLCLLMPDGTLEMTGSIGYPPGMLDRWQKFPLDTPLPLADAVRLAKPIHIHSPEERIARYPALATVTPVKSTQASACVPLLAGGRAIGVLGLSFDQPRQYSAADKEFMLSFARQCAQAVERARLFEAEAAARAEAERASRAKDEFLAVLSHELRTPLTPVLLTISLLESHPSLPEDLRSDVATIRRNVELESRLISDLLDLTRIAKGKLQLDIQDVDLHLVIRSAIDICQREASARLVVELDASCHIVRGDSTRLQQIFWNLINNAQKFTPPEGIIHVRSYDAGEGRIGVTVRDTGVGIEHDVLPRLFSAFEQGSVRTVRQQAGLGLGLAISRKLAEAHGGTIVADSPGTGQGAVFTVELPVVAVFVPDRVQRPAEMVRPARVSLDVLLVEDHEPTLAVLARLLKRLGHRVTGVSSVASATAAARQASYDVLISDLGLPDGSGLDLMRKVRDHFHGRSIALTGYGMESDIKASRAAGFAHHLTKPVDMAVLESTLDQIERRT